MGIAEEIAEQPVVVSRLLVEGRRDASRIASAVSGAFDSVIIAARGSSDHAAIYAQYLLGVALRLPVGLATPSVITRYGVQPQFRRTLVIGISQSGASPDVAAVLEAARRRGCPTIAITNEPTSPLASSADHVFELRAGPERAVAATKTFTASLVAVAMVNAALGGRPGFDVLDRLPGLLDEALTTAGGESGARGLVGFERMVVVGRGYGYALAREWALKMQELARVAAMAYSAADALHGPIAMLGLSDGICAVAFEGRTGDDVLAFLDACHRRLGREATVITDRSPRIDDSAVLRIPASPHEALAPIVGAVPAQQVAFELAMIRGLNPDRPNHIEKVTRTT